MIHINSENTRYFKRDQISMAWDRSAYDETLLGSKYPKQAFEQFFAKLEQLTAPAHRGCCTNRNTPDSHSVYLNNLKEFTSDENNKLKNNGLQWEIVGGGGVVDDHKNWARNTFLKLNIHGMNQNQMSNPGLTNPLMPQKF